MRKRQTGDRARHARFVHYVSRRLKFEPCPKSVSTARIPKQSRESLPCRCVGQGFVIRFTLWPATSAAETWNKPRSHRNLHPFLRPFVRKRMVFEPAFNQDAGPNNRPFNAIFGELSLFRKRQKAYPGSDSQERLHGCIPPPSLPAHPPTDAGPVSSL